MPRGAHNLTPEQRKEMSTKGGKAVQLRPNARRWTPEEARAFGRSGGLAKQRKKEEREADAYRKRIDSLFGEDSGTPQKKE
jgi:general stress protein YciG